MGPKKGGENSKKAAGNARKADAAAAKQAVADAKKAAEEDVEWSKGAKSNAKKEAADAKKADSARKKADRDAQLAEEEATTKSGKGAKGAAKKGGRNTGLDLSQLDDDGGAASKKPGLNASGIDNALDALSLTGGDAGRQRIDRHPERRFKAAYAAFEARRLPEIEVEHPGLRKNQRIEIVRKEFDKSEENPFNQAHVSYDATREDIARVRGAERAKIENRLAGK